MTVSYVERALKSSKTQAIPSHLLTYLEKIPSSAHMASSKVTKFCYRRQQSNRSATKLQIQRTMASSGPDQIAHDFLLVAANYPRQ